MNELNKIEVGFQAYIPPAPKAEADIQKNWEGDYTKPLVSVVCITYQHKEYINHAINSFLMQETTFPFEIIIRDDASTDGTKEIIKEYVKKYPNIIKPILESENQYSKGVKASMVTIPLAKGRYIALCEGDDYWMDKRKLQIQADFLESHKECVITYHDAIVIDNNGVITRDSLLGNNKQDYTKDELVYSAIVPTLTRFFRNVVQEFPEEMNKVGAGDIFLISLLSEYGGAKYLSEVAPSVYRQHGAGIWSGVNEAEKKQMLTVTFFWLAMYYKRIGKEAVANNIGMAALVNLSKPLKLSKFTSLKFFVLSFSADLYVWLRTIMRKFTS